MAFVLLNHSVHKKVQIIPIRPKDMHICDCGIGNQETTQTWYKMALTTLRFI